MAYKIRYHSVNQKKQSRHKFRLLVLTLCFFILFAVVSWHIAPAELTSLRQLLLPEERINVLLQDLLAGETIKDAVTAFCQGILDGE